MPVGNVAPDSLKELADAYVKIHGGTFRDALIEVAKLEAAECKRLIAEAEAKSRATGEPLRIPSLSRDSVKIKLTETRSILRDKALKFQETHPGTSFRDALTAVARDPAAGEKELKTPDGQMREALSQDARAYASKKGVSFSEALAHVHKVAREKGLIE